MTSPGLSFRWPGSRRFPAVFLGFLLLSAFGHAITFYLFQVEYPPSVTIAPPPARVSLLQPDSPRNRAFLQWIEASDPAAISRPPQIAVPSLGPIPYEPSYARTRSVPVVPAAPARVGTGLPDATNGLALMDGMMAPAEEAPAPRPIPPTQLVLSANLSHRAPREPTPLDLTPVEAADLVPATYMVGVGGSGDTQFVFLRTSSGAESLDRECAERLRKLKFQAAESGEIAWGFVTFLWGPEVLRTPSPATAP